MNELSFSLTDSQTKALSDIKKSFLANTQSMRLIQGDVGSGKTIIAVFSLIQAFENNLYNLGQ